MINRLAEQLPGESAWLDAQSLLARITGHNRSWLLSHPEAVLTTDQETALQQAIQQLNAGTPLPYVLGHWEFFGLDFVVTPDVLIPRPETELLIETAISYVRGAPNQFHRFLDVGTGSGIIPVTLATYLPGAAFFATDISPLALAVAQTNANRHGVDLRIEFVEADLYPDSFDDLDFDMITANLPYIPRETLKTLDVYGHEPDLALDGGEDGLEIISRLLSRLTRHGPPPGLILLEIEERQGADIRILARDALPSAEIHVRKDLSGRDRLAVISN